MVLKDGETLQTLRQTLLELIQSWETEIVEFKEAKSNFDTDKLGRYFSAISYWA